MDKIIIPDAALAAFEAKEAQWRKPVDELPDELPITLKAFLDAL